MSQSSAIERKQRHINKYASISTLLESELPAQSHSLARLYHKMIKSLAAFNLYKIQSDHVNAKKLALDLYRTASKYDAPKYLHEVADYLYMYYSLFEFDRKKALKYAKAKRKAQEAYSMEYKLSGYRSDIILAERSSHSKKNAVKVFENYWRIIEPRLETVKSWEFNRMAYLFGCQYYYKIGDRDKLLNITDRAISYLENFLLQSNNTLSIFYKYKLSGLTLDGYNSDYELFINKYASLVKKGSTNWFNFKYSICKLRLYQMDHQATKTILDEIFNNSKFRQIPDANRASWHILNAYQNFYERADDTISSPSRFRIAKFISDAKGNHFQSNTEQVQLHIIQILFYLLDKNNEAIELHSSAIEKYIARIGLRLKDRRSYTFLKMILSIPENQYNTHAVKRHTSQFYKKLKALKSSDSIHFEHIEIFPYEQLWAILLKRISST